MLPVFLAFGSVVDLCMIITDDDELLPCIDGEGVML